MTSRIRVAANGLAVALALVVASTVRATTLGNALSFGAISTGAKISMAKDSAIAAGDVGAQSISLAADASVSGDLIADVGGISLGHDASANGCVTSGPKVKLGSGTFCPTDTSGTSPDLALLSSAETDITTYLSAVAALTPTAVAAVKVPNNGMGSLDDTVSGGLNVFSTPSVTVGAGGNFEVVGLSMSDTAVVIVAGNVILKPGAVFVPTFSQAQLVVVVMGKVVSLAHDAVLDATVIAPNAKCSFGSDAAARGAFFCGKNISFAKDSALDSLSSTVTLP